MFNRYLIIVLIFSLGTAIFGRNHTAAGENSWTTEGPSGASVKTIAVHPSNSNILLIGTIQNGIYKSIDAGENWRHIDSEIMPTTLREIVYHAFAPDTVYASAVGGVYKSNDGGDTWNHITPPGRVGQEFRALVVDPFRPNVIITGGQADQWKSTDSGESWRDFAVDPPWPNGPDHEIDDIAIDPVNTDIAYLVTPDAEFGKGIYKCTDGGETWFCIHNNSDSSGLGTCVTIDPTNTDIIYYGRHDDLRVSNGRFLSKSYDGGASWTDISPAGLNEWGVSAIRVAPNDHNTLYLATRGDGVYKSTDGGQSWVEKNMGIGLTIGATIEIDAITGSLFLGIYLDGIYKSTDGGDNWQKISRNINAAGINDIAFAGQPNAAIFAVGATGCFSRASESPEWQSVNVGIPPTNLSSAVECDPDEPLNIYIASASPFYPPVLPNGLYISTDGGINWIFSNEGLPTDQRFEDVAVSYMNDGTRRFFLTAASWLQTDGIYFSDDMGQSWQRCSGVPIRPYRLLRVAPGYPYIIAATDYNNGIFISTDRGENWQETTPLPRYSDEWVEGLAFDPFDSSHLFASTRVYGLFESTDRGVTWTNISNDLPLHPTSQAVFGPAINPLNTQNMFVSSNRVGIYQTHDGGQHWHPFNTGLDTANASGNIYFSPGDTTRLYLASYARSVWSIRRTLTGAEDDAPPLPQAVSLSAYPNPFNSSTTINYSLPRSGWISISISNILGQSVATLYSGNQNAGAHSLAWDATPFSSGLYFARLNQDGNIKVAKLLLLK